jgi:hypothetical protein
MTITREILSDKLLSYLNQEIDLAALVDWAEHSFVDATLAPDADIDLLNDILGYLAAADTAQFPLTWEICSDFMQRLGAPVHVVRAVS